MDEIIDSRDDPKVIYVKLEEDRYKAELGLLDRFHAFSAELLRLSLVGIAVFGFLYQYLFSRINQSFPDFPFYHSPKWSSGISVLLFSFSAACALAHRYFSTDAAGFYIHGLRITSRIPEVEKQADEEAKLEKEALEKERDYWIARRETWLIICMWLKGLSTLFLALGSLLMAYAFFRLLIMQIAPVTGNK